MNTRPEFITDEMLDYLDSLKESHQADLFDWRHLRDVFTELTPEQAQEVIQYWHDERHS